MKKLLYITNGINGAAGLERVLSVKASYLADKLNYEVHILTLNNGNTNLFYEFSDKIIHHNIQVSGNPIHYVKSYLSGIKSIVKQLNPNIILVCDDGLKAFFLPLFLSKKIPLIYERHVSKNIVFAQNSGIIDKLKANIQFGLMNFLAPKFKKFVVLTEENRKEWKSKNVVVISNPLSFYPNENSSLQNKKVIAVGKQSHQKGYDRLLQSWKIVIEKHPDWQLEIYGKFDANQKLDELATQLEIKNNILFFEPIANIEQKYLESSIYAMSSRYEGFGMVLIEAMACGVPCVSFNCPYGPSDIIEDKIDGFLVNNDDYKAFANKLILLIENKELRDMMGKNAKENVKRFLPEVILQQWDELFKSLIK
ncbi:glycosyltransferase family 4 protein [Flavobacterium sp.]|uniref:glycosyltransferase family 4 protein n=1 Tax=Flavobacterium sp. TaxID=239 RepID=UPI0037520F9B